MLYTSTCLGRVDRIKYCELHIHTLYLQASASMQRKKKKNTKEYNFSDQFLFSCLQIRDLFFEFLTKHLSKKSLLSNLRLSSKSDTKIMAKRIMLFNPNRFGNTSESHTQNAVHKNMQLSHDSIK